MVAFTIGNADIAVESRDGAFALATGLSSSGRLGLVSPFILDAGFALGSPRLRSGGREDSLAAVDLAFAGRFERNAGEFSVSRSRARRARSPGPRRHRLREPRTAHLPRVRSASPHREPRSRGRASRPAPARRGPGRRAPGPGRALRKIHPPADEPGVDRQSLRLALARGRRARSRRPRPPSPRPRRRPHRRLRPDAATRALRSTCASTLGRIAASGLAVAGSTVRLVASGTKAAAAISRFDASLTGLDIAVAEGKTLAFDRATIAAKGGFDLSRKSLSVASFEASLPGLAPLRLSGRYGFGQDGAADLRLESRGLDLPALRGLAAPFIPAELRRLGPRRHSGPLSLRPAPGRVPCAAWAFPPRSPWPGSGSTIPRSPSPARTSIPSSSSKPSGSALGRDLVHGRPRRRPGRIAVEGGLHTVGQEPARPRLRRPLRSALRRRRRAHCPRPPADDRQRRRRRVGRNGPRAFVRPADGGESEPRTAPCALFPGRRLRGGPDEARGRARGVRSACRKGGGELSAAAASSSPARTSSVPLSKTFFLGISGDIPVHYESGKAGSPAGAGDPGAPDAPLPETGFLLVGEFQNPLLTLKTIDISLRSGVNALGLEPLSLDVLRRPSRARPDDLPPRPRFRDLPRPRVPGPARHRHRPLPHRVAPVQADGQDPGRFSASRHRPRPDRGVRPGRGRRLRRQDRPARPGRDEPVRTGPLDLAQRRPRRPRLEEAHRRGPLRRGHRHRPGRGPRPGHHLRPAGAVRLPARVRAPQGRRPDLQPQGRGQPDRPQLGPAGLGRNGRLLDEPHPRLPLSEAGHRQHAPQRHLHPQRHHPRGRRRVPGEEAGAFWYKCGEPRARTRVISFKEMTGRLKRVGQSEK
ncbi:MAG: hypothetical protein MZV63_65240 [Marinilabiliales bacterium]|nr:hypothetical protein [Marinilabiliales bacterium]